MARFVLTILAFGLWFQNSTFAAEPSITLWGTLTNTFYFGTKIIEEPRAFRVVIEGTNSFYDITNATKGAISRGAFKDGEFSYISQKPRTNEEGKMTSPLAARIEMQVTPRDDGSCINYLWLAFGSHAYLTSHTNTFVMPIWRTGLSDSNEVDKIRATYRPLRDSRFPDEVAYINDGFDYFEGRTDGTLQKLRFPPPFNLGFTNFYGRTQSSTNINGLLLPTSFEITRIGHKWNGSMDKFQLQLVSESKITIHKIAIGVDKVSHPKFAGRIATIDSRVTPGYPVMMSDGVWPNIEKVRKAAKLQQAAEQRRSP